MAALTKVELTKRMPLGDRFLETFRVTTGVASATEWIATGLSDIDAVLGAILTGTAPLAAGAVTAPTQATYILDMSGDTPADGDTVTIGAAVYTLRTTIGVLRYSVLVSGTPATQASLLAEAINANAGTPTTNYTVDTPSNPDFTAAVSGDTVVITARVPGTVMNGHTVTTDITGATFAAGVTAADTLVAGASFNFVKNAQGTGVAADTNLGDLGVESPTAVTLEVTVIGRP